MSTAARCLVAIFLAVFLMPMADARTNASEDVRITSDDAGGEPAGTAYRVEITGVPEPRLRELLEQASLLIQLRDRAPSTVPGLTRRIRTDIEQLRRVLRSEGFYAGEVTDELVRDAAPLVVRLAVATGPVYLLADFVPRYAGPAAAGPLPGDLEDLGLHVGMPARAADIVAAERKLVRRLTETGYPLARVVDRRTTVDHATTTMSVVLTVDQGPAASFGPVRIDGLTVVDEDYIRRFLGWREGERFDSRKVEATRSDIAGTNLFSAVTITHAKAPDGEGRLPIVVSAVERPVRSLGARASYSTSEGGAGELFWEHRSLFRENEKWRITAGVAEIQQGLTMDFRKPNYRRRNQNFVLDGALVQRATDAFDERSIAALVALERPVGKLWRASLGSSAEYSVVERDSQGQHLLFGLPLAVTRDSSDDRLDPTRGSRLSLSVTPFIGTIEDTVSFLSTTVQGTTYVRLGASDRVVLAGRARLGSIIGENTAQIPASKRLFAGGGGSIRGYAFQSVGPLDANRDPVGGRSVLELGGELRLKLTENLGIVPFLEGGTAYDEILPTGDQSLLWAAGIGLRYFTKIAPIRLDIAFPLDRRHGVDDTFQFYISLGQAF